MKIAVSASGNNLESQLNPRFGRSSGFVVYDTKTEGTLFLDNSDNLSLSQGAGIKTEILITGQLGPKAAQALSRAKIRIYYCSAGRVREAIKAFQESRLDELTSDKIQAGPGKMGGRGMGGGGRGRGQGPGR